VTLRIVQARCVSDDLVTTYKTYHGTHCGEFHGVAPTGRQVAFETVDVMRVREGRIVEHWGVANLYLSSSNSPNREATLIKNQRIISA
jgi:predicted ester cyclase